MTDINFQVLMNAGVEALCVEREYWEFVVKHKGPFGLDLNPTENVEYWVLSERVSTKWDVVKDMCRLVGFDFSVVVSVIKSIERWQSHGGKWDLDRCVWGNRLKSYQHLCTPRWDAGCYRTTGRKINA